MERTEAAEDERIWRWEGRLDIEEEKEEWSERKQQNEKEEYDIEEEKEEWRERKQQKRKYEDGKEEYDREQKKEWR